MDEIPLKMFTSYCDLLIRENKVYLSRQNVEMYFLANLTGSMIETKFPRVFHYKNKYSSFFLGGGNRNRNGQSLMLTLFRRTGSKEKRRLEKRGKEFGERRKQRIW